MGMKPSLRPARSGARYLLPAALCVVTAAACGSATSTSSPAKPAKPAAKVSLTVVVTPSPGATPQAVDAALRPDRRDAPGRPGRLP